MLNKNDPLIGAVQEVMKKNQAEREAAKIVNEAFGVEDRKALPHELQGEWDAAYKSVLTEGVEALDELKGITSNTGARAGYMLKGIGSAVRAGLTGDERTYKNRIKGLEGAKKKSEAATKKEKEGAANNETARKVLKDMGRKTGYGAIYDKMFKEEALDEAKLSPEHKKVITQKLQNIHGKGKVKFGPNGATWSDGTEERTHDVTVNKSGKVKMDSSPYVESQLEEEALDEKSFAALAPPYDKSTQKDRLVGAGVLKKHPTQPGKHILAKEEMMNPTSAPTSQTPASTVRKAAVKQNIRMGGNPTGAASSQTPASTVRKAAVKQNIRMGGNPTGSPVRPSSSKGPMEEENAPKTDPYIEGQASSISTVPQPKKEVTPADQSALKKKIQSIMKESNLQEKAVSKAQHRFFGLVRGIQKGKAHGSAKAEKAAETMSAKSVRDYAKTSEKGLPEKVSEAMDQSQIRGQSNVAGARLSGSFTTQGALPRPPRPAIDSAPRPQQASPMMGQGAPGIKKQPGGARPSVVAKNTPTTSAAAKEVAGARLSGSFTTQGALPQKPASAAKIGPSFERTGRNGSPSMAPKPADRPNDLGKAGVPGTGGKLAPAAAAPKPTAKPVQAVKKPAAAAPVKNASTRGGTMSQSDANVLAKVKAGGGQKLSKILPSGRERLKFFAARNAERRGP